MATYVNRLNQYRQKIFFLNHLISTVQQIFFLVSAVKKIKSGIFFVKNEKSKNMVLSELQMRRAPCFTFFNFIKKYATFDFFYASYFC